MESDNRPVGVPRYFTINEVMAQLGGEAKSAAAARPYRVAVNVPPPRAAAESSARGGEGDEPFGLVSFRAPEGQLWVKWRELEAEMAREADVLARCRAEGRHCEAPAVRAYLAMIEQARRLSGRVKIAWLNRTINAAVRYMSDPDQYGVDDRWTAPLATLAAAAGDCEDYAILKYVALRDAGYSMEDLRLVIVRDRLARQDHAVTAVREEGLWLLLDNRHDVLLERKDAWHFTPLFVLDREGVKLLAAPYAVPPSASASVPPGAASSQQALAPPAAGDSRDSLGLRLDAFEPPPLRGGL